MADNKTFQSATLATLPSGTVCATDEIGGVDYQRIKIVDGTDGSTTALIVNSSGAAKVAFGPDLTKLSATSSGLTTASTAYTPGDQLGTILSWSNAAATSGGFGYITKAALLDKAKVVGAIDIYLFSASVTGAADNAAADFSDSDMDTYCVGVLQMPAPVTNASNGFASLDLQSPIKCDATTLYGMMVTRYGHTFFGATTDLVVKLFIERL